MNKIQCLLTAIEEKVGYSMQSNSDFVRLSTEIFEQEHENISTSTLMRMWGYRPFVEPRKSTLDILARFVGYKDSVDFFASKNELPQSHLPETILETSKKKNYRLWMLMGGVAIIVLLVSAVLYNMMKEPEPRRIMKPSELVNTKQYTIRSRYGMRGELGVFNYQLSTTYELAKDKRCLQPGRFAILNYEGDLYLYSIDDKRFINFTSHEVDAPLAIDGLKLKLTPRDSCLLMSFSWRNMDYTLNMNVGNGVIITDYGLVTGDFDDGNLLEVYEVGDFDPTEPLQRIKRYKAELKRAQNSIEPEKRYVIYTRMGVDGHEGKKRYYLTAGGLLSETLSDSCYFTFHKIEGDTIYATPTYRACLHRANKSVPEGCKTGFCFSKYGSEYRRVHKGQISVVPYYRNDFNSQIFFQDERGRYAIRCTSAIISAWFSGAYWCVIDANKDGKPDVDYSVERKFIWYIERISDRTATD